MMTLTDQTMAVAGAFCAAEGCDLARASQRALGDARRLPRIEAGTGSITLDRADRALAWFSAHWPASALWPDGVPRPSVSGSAAPCAAEPNSGAAPEGAAALPAAADPVSRPAGAGLCLAGAAA
jgi:hypothetical protein